MTNDATSYVCLFHHPRQAQAAVADLLRAGIPESAIATINNVPGQSGLSSTSLEELAVPDRDLVHLRDGIREGGIVVSVSAMQQHEQAIEQIFERNQAGKIDEAELASAIPPMVAPSAAAAPAAIPIVEEELVVGKRTIDRGGVRVYRRVVEIPVEQAVSLHEEHVTVERHLVDRPATEQDLATGGQRTIELTETAEELVIGKSAQVVEEVHIGKVGSERTEHIQDTVRRTEVDVEALEAEPGTPTSQRTI